MSRGRPSDYKPEYCDAFIQFMKDNSGAALVEFAASIGTSKQSVHRWIKAHEDFRYAYEVAMTLSENWWAKLGRDGAIRDGEGKTLLDTQLYKFKTSARFGWSEKTEVKEESKQTVVQLAYNLEDEDDK